MIFKDISRAWIKYIYSPVPMTSYHNILIDTKFLIYSGQQAGILETTSPKTFS